MTFNTTYLYLLVILLYLKKFKYCLDFSFLEIVLFPRTRNEIKNKFLREEKY